MKSNITTYIKFRGDVSYKNVPFNEVDMVIFSSLAYIDFNAIRAYLPVTLSEAFHILKKSEEYENKQMFCMEDYRNLELMSDTIRYKNIKIVQLSDIKDEKTITQFAAITLLLPDDSLVVAYRGTDDSVIGWHEDFNMYLDEPIGARDRAVEYLEKAAALKLVKKWYFFNKELPIIIVGHSKGGHLALVASLYAVDLHSRIQKVYNFDGPGLPSDDIKRDGYSEIIKKTVTYIPGYSFFGRLFHHEEEIKVVASCNQGLEQHKIHSWLVEPERLAEGILEQQGTEFFNKANEFVNKLGTDYLKEFVEALFSLLKFLELENISDLEHVELSKYIDAFFNFKGINMKAKIEIIKFIQLMSSEMKRSKNLIDNYS